MWWNNKRRNGSDSCPSKMPQFIITCTHPLHLLLPVLAVSLHRPVRLLTVFCQLKGFENEEFIAITSTVKQVNNKCTVYIYKYMKWTRSTCSLWERESVCVCACVCTNVPVNDSYNTTTHNNNNSTL